MFQRASRAGYRVLQGVFAPKEVRIVGELIAASLQRGGFLLVLLGALVFAVVGMWIETAQTASGLLVRLAQVELLLAAIVLPRELRRNALADQILVLPISSMAYTVAFLRVFFVLLLVTLTTQAFYYRYYIAAWVHNGLPGFSDGLRWFFWVLTVIWAFYWGAVLSVRHFAIAALTVFLILRVTGSVHPSDKAYPVVTGCCIIAVGVLMAFVCSRTYVYRLQTRLQPTPLAAADVGPRNAGMSDSN